MRPTGLTVGEGPTMKTYQEGIYFNMPFEEYLQLPCLSSSGIKNLLISPTDFWANSWMNPLREDLTEEKKHYEDGKAYHKRILEGKEAFYLQYAPDYEDDGGDMIRTGKEITAALRACGAKITYDNVLEGAQRLKDATPSARIMCLEEHEHRQKFKDRQFISAKLIRYIEYSSRMIECDPRINTFFIGGHPEITILWYDDDYQAWFKIRFDYLKVGPGCDLKTFANPLEQNIDIAIDKAIAGRRYFIQAALYLMGNDIAKGFAADGRVFGFTGDPKWLETYARTPCDRFNFVFQKKGIAPLARGRYITKEGSFYRNGVSKIVEAVDTYHRSLNTFGTDMWLTSVEPTECDSNAMPAYSEYL